MAYDPYGFGAPAYPPYMVMPQQVYDPNAQMYGAAGYAPQPIYGAPYAPQPVYGAPPPEGTFNIL